MTTHSNLLYLMTDMLETLLLDTKTIMQKNGFDRLASDLAEGFHIAHRADTAEHRQEDQRS